MAGRSVCDVTHLAGWMSDWLVSDMPEASFERLQSLCPPKGQAAIAAAPVEAALWLHMTGLRRRGATIATAA
jgi:hypothetical protein